MVVWVCCTATGEVAESADVVLHGTMDSCYARCLLLEHDGAAASEQVHGQKKCHAAVLQFLCE
jgi:hypothetical protein